MSTSPSPISRHERSQPSARAVAMSRPDERPRRHRLLLAAFVLGGALILATIGATRTAAQEWQISQIEQGTKPALALTPEETRS
jgi:hypothetical protein